MYKQDKGYIEIIFCGCIQYVYFNLKVYATNIADYNSLVMRDSPGVERGEPSLQLEEYPAWNTNTVTGHNTPMQYIIVQYITCKYMQHLDHIYIDICMMQYGKKIYLYTNSKDI